MHFLKKSGLRKIVVFGLIPGNLMDSRMEEAGLCQKLEEFWRVQEDRGMASPGKIADDQVINIYQQLKMKAEKSVLVTVGTTKFDSLIKATDEDKFVAMLSEAGYGNITYQVGLKGEYQPKHGNSFLSTPNIASVYNSADLIIAHGGAGTLLQTLHQGKLIIAVANDELQGNHQLELVSMLGSQNYIKGYASVEQLMDGVEELKQWLKSPAVSKYEVPSNSVLNRIVFDE